MKPRNLIAGMAAIAITTAASAATLTGELWCDQDPQGSSDSSCVLYVPGESLGDVAYFSEAPSYAEPVLVTYYVVEPVDDTAVFVMNTDDAVAFDWAPYDWRASAVFEPPMIVASNDLSHSRTSTE